MNDNNKPEKELTDLEKAARYIKQYCNDNECKDCKYYKNERFNIGCEFRLNNPCSWRI